ncbi:hypothetical protein [Vagococcus carniphilus]|uniref:hypothetical protein n=1 Tax=Vagococcus carniphilus TaxID=218144 RepID=UPI003B5A06D1
MKKKTYCSVVLRLLLCTSANTAFAEEGLKIPEFNENELEVVKPENTKPLASVKSFSKQQAPIYLSKEEVKEIKELQEKYFKNTQEPSVNKLSKYPVYRDGVYELGIYNDEALNSVENHLNFYRELAGVHPIKIFKDDNNFAQYGAIGLAIVGKLTHELPREYKPADMEEFFCIWLLIQQSPLIFQVMVLQEMWKLHLIKNWIVTLLIVKIITRTLNIECGYWGYKQGLLE